MDTPTTEYAVRGGVHIGYQVWGSGPIDVVEIGTGLMISIDETVDEPTWLRHTQRLAEFCRLLRLTGAASGCPIRSRRGRTPPLRGGASTRSR